MNSYIDLESLRANFPEGFPVPQLLLEFANWLKAHPEQKLGSFEIVCDRFNDYWIEEGADLSPFFAFFLREGSGGTIGYWLYEGLKTISPPIVLVGSEGEQKILAEDLLGFLRHFVTGGEAAELLENYHGKPSKQELKEFSAWLDERQTETEPTPRVTHPNFEEWIENWVQPRRERFEIDPVHVDLTNRLRRYLKPDAEEWNSECFDVLLVGNHFQMWHRSYGPQAMPRKDYQELEPLFRTLRDQRVEQMPERGAWFYAWVSVYPNSPATLACEFMSHPKVGDDVPEISDSDLQLDLAKYPRSVYWMPEWLSERLKSV